MGPTWGHLGPVGPRWPPCWRHEPCYQGWYMLHVSESGLSSHKWHGDVFAQSVDIPVLFERLLCGTELTQKGHHWYMVYPIKYVHGFLIRFCGYRYCFSEFVNVIYLHILFNTLRPRQNGCHFPDDIFKWIFLNENVWTWINISLKFVPRGPINNIPTLVQVMAWRRPGDKPLSEPTMVRLPTRICVTRPQWVKAQCQWQNPGRYG